MGACRQLIYLCRQRKLVDTRNHLYAHMQSLIIGAGLTLGDEVILRLPEMLPTLREVGAWSGVAGTSLIAVFAFIGFEHLVNVSEEMQQPNRTLPRALFITLGLTALIYALVVWIAVIAVPPATLA